MVRTLRTIPIALLIIACAALPACKSAPKPPKPQTVKLIVSATTDVNPDALGRASPVVVRIYQLRDDAAFKDADFFALYDKEQATLSASLISREEFQVAPGTQKTADYQLSLDARFVGVAAAYRDIRNASWRAELGSQGKGLAAMAKKKTMNVVADRTSVSLSAE